jgi:squalene-hopene/tetraprenyl-beta-curcumene cyclase
MEAALNTAIDRASIALGSAQRPDGHWVFELEADATIPAEYILLRHYLGEPDDLELEAGIGRYLRRIQAPHGGWSLYHEGGFDLSATVKAYYALKMIGDAIDAPHMARARAEILAHGGAAAANVFTRIQLALFGAGAWSAVPTCRRKSSCCRALPDPSVENVLLGAHRDRAVAGAAGAEARRAQRARYPGRRALSAGPRQDLARASKGKFLWTHGFNVLDIGLKAFDGLWPKKLRKRAIQACVDFTIERLNGEDGLGAIYPAMANSVMMFDCLGYAEDHPHRAIARRSVEKLLVRRDDGETYCQPCVSPVWDTALAAQAMLEVRGDAAEGMAATAMDWLKPLQVLDVKGDWADERPMCAPAAGPSSIATIIIPISTTPPWS